MSDEIETTPEQDEIILFLAVITKAFSDNDNKPVSFTVADFEPLSFKKVNQFIDHFTGDKTFILHSRPKTAKDKTLFKLEQSEWQKKELAKTKTEMEHLRDMQMLTIYWGKICQIYDAITGGNVGFEDGLINRHYLLLSIKFDKILTKDDFSELHEQKPFIYDSLMGNQEDLDMSYEFMRPEIWGFYGRLERQWVEKAEGIGGAFELDDKEQKLLDDTDNAIEQHKKQKSKINTNFEKHLDAVARKAKAEGNSKTDKKKEPDQTGSPLEYDDEHGKAIYKDRTEKMFDALTIMGVLTNRVTWADGARINASDILLHIEAKRIDPDKEKTTKTLTNAKDRVNTRFQEMFGIHNVVCYERQQFWLNEKYCSEKSPYRMATSGN